MHILQSVMWPGAPAFGPDILYMRAEPRPAWKLKDGGGITAGPVRGHDQLRLDFSTFFGAFSLSTWCGPAGVGSVALELEFEGSATLELYEDNGHEGPQLLLKRRLVGDGRKQYVEAPDLAGHRGILFPVLVLEPGDELDLAAVRYCTREPPRHSPRLAIIMPTYRREKIVTQNIARISAGLLARHPECRLFVVDNGSSLELAPMPGVELVRNPNYGGSGGFARGLLEVYAAEQPYTHVLFCDDDVLVNPHCIARLLSLLRYTGDVVVSGGMLQMGARHILDQKSCYVVGIALSRNHGFQNLSQLEHISRYDEPGFSSFCGWWFACYPLMQGRERFMPLPFFIGWDDIEMGRRCKRMGVPMISLLGVAIWHEEFEKKDRAWRGFYHARNGLITAMLHESGPLALKQLWVEIIRAMETYRYDRAEFMIDGLDAVRRGPQALRETRADELHDALVNRPQVQMTDVREFVIPERVKPREHARGRLLRFWSRITLNGHLIPPWFFKSAREPAFPGWAFEDLHSWARARILRKRKVVYYEATTGQGMVCTVDHSRFFRLLARVLFSWVAIRLRWRRLRDAWRAEEALLTSPAFWDEYLGRTAASRAQAPRAVEASPAEAK